jgi:hypothetical protein
LLAGAWCSLCQLTLVYGLSCLYSATLPAYMQTMLCWFVGSACGAWLPSTWRSKWLFATGLVAHLSNTAMLSSGIYVGSWLFAAFAGGLAGGHWVRRWGLGDLRCALFWESCGIAAGFLIGFLLIYPWGLGLIWGAPIVASLAVTLLEPMERSQ